MSYKKCEITRTETDQNIQAEGLKGTVSKVGEDDYKGKNTPDSFWERMRHRQKRANKAVRNSDVAESPGDMQKIGDVADYGTQSLREEAGTGINVWIEQANELITDTNNHFSTWNTDTDKDAEFQLYATRLLKLADQWRKLYKDDSDALAAIDTVADFLGGIGEYIQARRDQFSQYGSAEEYNTAQREREAFFEQHGTVESRQAWYAEQEAKVAALESYYNNYYTIDLLYQDYLTNPSAYTPEEAQEIIAKYEHHKTYSQIYDSLEDVKNELDATETEMRNYRRGNYNEYGQFYGSKVVDDHYHVTQKVDFDTVSANRNYSNPTPEEYMEDKWHLDENGVFRDEHGNAAETSEPGVWSDPRNKDMLIEDKLGLFLSATEEQRYHGAAGYWGIDNVSAVFLEGLQRDWKYLEDWEVGVYYYYLAESQEKAYQCLSDMEKELNRRRTMADTERWESKYEQANTLEKFWMNLETVPASLVGSFGGFVTDTIDTLQGEEINPYSTAHTLSHYSRTVRGATAEELDGVEILGDFFTLGDLYQTGMSMVDSLAAVGVGGQFGSVLLAMGAAENEAYRLYQQGASNEQIAFGAAAAGATELIFEKLSLGNLDQIKNMASPKTLGQWFKTVLVQGGVDASEEMLTEIANTVANAFIMGSQSDWQKLMDENGSNLLSALQDKTLDVIHSGLGGFLSGGTTGAFESGSSYVDYVTGKNAEAKHMYGDSADALVDEALEINPANAFAQKMQNRVINGKQLTGGQLSRLVEQNESAILTQEKAAIQQAAQAQLTKLGETGNVSELAAVLAKQAAGETLSHAEKRLIAKSRYGQQVASELDPANIRAGTTDSAWVQNIGTERINTSEYNSGFATDAQQTQANTDPQKPFLPLRGAEGDAAISNAGSADPSLSLRTGPQTGVPISGESTAVPSTQQVLQQALDNMSKHPMDPKSYNALFSYKNQLQHVDTTEKLLNQKREILQQQKAAGEQTWQTEFDIKTLEKKLAIGQRKLQNAFGDPALQQVVDKTATQMQRQQEIAVENNGENALDISRTNGRIGEENSELDQHVAVDGNDAEAGPDKVKKFRCRNEKLAGKKHPVTGVSFARKTVKLGGVQIEVVVPEFKSFYEAQLPEEMYGMSHKKQVQESSRQLWNEMQTNEELYQMFTEEQRESIRKGKTPAGFVWHHEAEAGKLSLVDRTAHEKTGHTGGRSIWGGGTGNR